MTDSEIDDVQVKMSPSESSEKSCDLRGEEKVKDNRTSEVRNLDIDQSNNCQSHDMKHDQSNDLKNDQSNDITKSELKELESDQSKDLEIDQLIDSEKTQSNDIEDDQSKDSKNDQSKDNENDQSKYKVRENDQSSAQLNTSSESAVNENITNSAELSAVAVADGNVGHAERKEENVLEADLGVYLDMDDDSSVTSYEKSSKQTEKQDDGDSKSRSTVKKEEKEVGIQSRSESRIHFKDPDKPGGNDVDEIESMSGVHRKVNTPVSHINNDVNLLEPRNVESREATFKQAMNLMSTRCSSEQKDIPYGPYLPEYFYIHQKRPCPMPPLKAWRGYHGNVYFEPITINSLQQNQSTNVPLDRCNHRNHQMLLARSRMSSQNNVQSRQFVHSRPVTQQLVVLDRNVVLNKFNENSTQDLVWLEGQDSTGSLAIRPQSFGSRRRPASSRHDRICKGSVSRKMNEAAKRKNQPEMRIMGDKFVHPSAMSPLLRSTTQYSLSNQRNVMSSPDLYHGHHGYHDLLPPVEQMRVSLRHIDNSRDNYSHMSPYTRSTPYTEDLKPFIKYSPEIKAKFGRRLTTM
ncbi:uncharacterized protein LOC126830093 [Patella vulgata]|uniref:uncharacterized protein LOC126830093 n=1 Tax=Patella vulgata TaxID=6465 RepID=UPI0024A8FC8C|nr:uncharacterized protein LOC126830093 [Patella vulgata]XP_050416322.2 uncharacterized protein LOC126830093 [Patella vulgata]